MTRLAVCAIFKNEAPYLLEWIAWHHAAGVAHFFLYDNDSSDDGAAVIQRSPLAGLVTLTRWPFRPGQLPAYQHFIANFAATCDWVAFIDVDEFIVPLREKTIGAVLDQRRDFAAVLVHWRVFGPSGHVARPDGLVVQNYTMRMPDDDPANRHVKSIVRCASLVDVTHNPHVFVLRGEACDASGRPVTNIAIQPSACHTDLVINHYQTRSRADWADKIGRGSAMFNLQGPQYRAELVDYFEAASTVRDVMIQEFLPQVQEGLTMSRDVNWVAQRPSGFQHPGGLAMAFCDHGRPGKPWMAALRGVTEPGQVEPDFLLDDLGRICEFASFDEARAACEMALEARNGGG